MAEAPRRPRGLGQGLALLLGDHPAGSGTHDTGRLLHLEPTRIVPNPRQPRARIDEAAFADLVQSVTRDGIVQPIVVREVAGGYELIAGERRWRAAQAAGLARIPAVVREADDLEALALALVENVVRADLNPIEQARAYARLADEFGLTQAEIGEAVGRSRVSVANAVRLLDLPDEVLALIEQGSLSEGHGRAILQVQDHGARRTLGEAAARSGLSVRETEARARRPAPGRVRAKAVAPGTPVWLDSDRANDVADAVYRTLGLTARVVGDGSRCRVEIAVHSAEDVERLLHLLEQPVEA